MINYSITNSGTARHYTLPEMMQLESYSITCKFFVLKIFYLIQSRLKFYFSGNTGDIQDIYRENTGKHITRKQSQILKVGSCKESLIWYLPQENVKKMGGGRTVYVNLKRIKKHNQMQWWSLTDCYFEQNS